MLETLKGVGIITQARLSSTRLPRKILIPVLNKTILEHHIDRLRISNIPIFIATSNQNDDNEVVDMANKLNVPHYRGELHDVLSRFYHCAKQYQLKTIIRVTSDCPLIDGALIRNALIEYQKADNPFLYLSNVVERTYPRGFDFEIFSFEALEQAYLKGKEEIYREHVTPYINRNIGGNISFKHIKRSSDANKFRITLDTPDDLKLIQKLIEEMNCLEMDAEQIISLFESHPELHAINAHIEQKKV